VIPRASFSAQTEADLRSLMEKHFQSSIQFDFEYVSEINAQPSGKCPIVVNEIAQKEETVGELQSR
jgi:hypothetical protein